MERSRQRESSKSSGKSSEASSTSPSGTGMALRKCSSMYYEKTSKSSSGQQSLKKCKTSAAMMPVKDDHDDVHPVETPDALAHIIARPDVSLLQRRESERTLPTSALAQLFSSNQKKAGESSRILVNITIKGSSGALKVLVGSHSDRTQVMKQALAVYAREGRLPVLVCGEDAYELYCGHDMFTVVPADQRIGSLGYRNFFMCRRATAVTPAQQKQGSRSPKEERAANKTSNAVSFMSYYVHITL